MRAASSPPAEMGGYPATRRHCKVAVCIPTFRRPRMLRALLDSLARLRYPAGEEPCLRVFVADNDAAGSAGPVVRGAGGGRAKVVYVVEPERNIARARNRAVAEALHWGADFVAFVDDDEVVDPEWLHRLLEVQQRYGADVVNGPVIARLPAGTPGWLEDGRLFAGPRHPTGQRLTYAYTSNALVAARLLRAGAPAPAGPFDPSFGISGGSDSLFFAGWQREGVRMVWAADALVEERVPPTRVRARWLLQREFRVGNAAVFCERALPRGKRRLGRQVARASARLLLGAAGCVVAPLRGRPGVVRALRGVAYGLGSFTALTGYRYLEYSTVHGE